VAQNELNSLLCTDLAIWPSLGDPVPVSNAILHATQLKMALVNRLVLYDQIVIPTGNLLILPVLRQWLGDRAVRNLLNDEIIVLSRYDQWFSYIGNGGGLQFFQIALGDTPGADRHNIATLTYAPLDEAAAEIIRLGVPATADFERPSLHRLLMDKIKPIALGQYAEKLRHETYTDIVNSPTLRSFFALRNTNLDRLHGINPDQVTVEDVHRPGGVESPEIAAVLRIAFENTLLTIASETAGSLQGDLRAETVLKAKAERLRLGKPTLDGFLSVANLRGVPDIGAAVVAGTLDFDGLMRIREAPATARLRRWLRQVDPLQAEDVLRAFVDGIGQKSMIEQLPAKVLRLVTTTALGLIPNIGNVTGTLASFVDSFLLEKWFPGSAPHLLVDGFRTVVVEEKKELAKKVGRNVPQK
jgi:hypothetical protein